MSILQTTELKKYYGAKPNITRALDGVTLSIEKGEFVAIVGASGSGKSTLLHLIGGVDRPTSGKIFVDGNDISKMNDDKLAVFRRRQVGIVYQFYNLIPRLVCRPLLKYEEVSIFLTRKALLSPQTRPFPPKKKCRQAR